MRHLWVAVCLALIGCAAQKAAVPPANSEAQSVLAKIKADIDGMERQFGVRADRVMMSPKVWAQLRVLTHGRPVETLVGIPVIVRSEVYGWTVVMQVDGGQAPPAR